MNLYALVFGESVLNDAVSFCSILLMVHCFMFLIYHAARAHYLLSEMVLCRWQYLCTGKLSTCICPLWWELLVRFLNHLLFLYAEQCPL